MKKRAVVRQAARDDYTFAAIVTGIVASDAFRMQAPAHMAEAPPAAATASAADAR